MTFKGKSTTTMKRYCLEISGDLACFTRPEMKVERVSYDVITPSAARAVFEISGGPFRQRNQHYEKHTRNSLRSYGRATAR